MRRFIFFLTLFLIMTVTGVLFYMIQGTPFNVDVEFMADGGAIYQVTPEGNKAFNLNGTNLIPVEPGVLPSEDRITYDTYVLWFNMMYEMGLNTIKVDGIMPSRFYEALQDYNLNNDEPLYLIQGVYFDEVALKDGFLPLDKKWKEAFKDDIKEAIDAVHGSMRMMESIYVFRRRHIDVSDYVIGYTLGVNWGADDIAASNELFDLEPFTGRYFRTTSEANDFEHFIAEMLEYAVWYESVNYLKQSLYTVNAHGGRVIQSVVPQERLEVYDSIRTYPVVNLEHIYTTEDLKSGLFVSYDIEHLSDAMNLNLNGSSEGALSNGLDFLLAYHSYPVIISAYGIPNARFGAEYARSQEVPYMDEAKQAQRTVEQYRTLRSKGVAGQFIRDWQDAWFKSSWYTKDLKVLDQSMLWLDRQTYAQGFGMIGYEPDPQYAHYPDGSLEEWNEEESLINDQEVSLFVAHDPSYLHFLVQANQVIYERDKFFIGFDITPHSGTRRFEDYDLRFDTPVDFVLVMDLDGVQELFVHEYYDVFTFRKNSNHIKKRPDLLDIAKDSTQFNQIYQYSDYSALVQRFKPEDDDDYRRTGEMIRGNGNPDSEMYLSEADWYLGEDYLEIRIPYSLLNFMSPSSKMVLDDFYKHHTLRMKKVNGIKIAFIYETADKRNVFTSVDYTWDDWLSLTYTLRAKHVYEAMQEAMRGK